MRKFTFLLAVVIFMTCLISACKPDEPVSPGGGGTDTSGNDTTKHDTTNHNDTTVDDTMAKYPNYIIVEGANFPSDFDTITGFDTVYRKVIGGSFPEIDLEVKFPIFNSRCSAELSIYHEDSAILDNTYGVAQNFSKNKAVGMLLYYGKCVSNQETIRAYPESKNGTYKVYMYQGRRVSEFFKIKVYDPLEKKTFHVSGKITWPK